MVSEATSAGMRSRPSVSREGQHGFVLLQEKWVAFIIDTLGAGSMGFNEISRVAACISPATLSQRLSLLEKERILTKTIRSTMPPRVSYDLTPAGEALLPILHEIKTWACIHLSLPGEYPVEKQDIRLK